MALSRLQRVITRLAHRSWAEAMERESRQWLVRCGTCGFERSLWELGGIRWKASRTQRTATWGRCPNCGNLGWHRVIWRDATDPDSAS
jgi:hypothetical protein